MLVLRTWRKACTLAFLVALCISSPEAEANNIAVTDWSLSTAIQDNVGQTVHGFGTPMNPFVNFDGVIRGASTAQSAYMIHYARQALSFMITSDHHCQHTGNFPRCTSVGDVYITTTNPMLINVTSSTDYSFSGESMAAINDFAVIDLSSAVPHVIFGVSQTADALFDPHTGTLSLGSQFILPAGNNYKLSYALDVLFRPGAQNNSIATLYGTLNFELSPIPEPTGAFYGAVATTALVCRRRRGHQR